MERIDILNELRGSTALDSNALVEYPTATRLGSILREYFKTLTPEETVNASILAIAQTFYVLCSKKGQKFASEKIGEILSSRVIEIFSSVDFAVETGKLKCERAISLADCSCLVAAKLARAKAVFAVRENELVREMKKTPFEMEIAFLQDMTSEGD